MALWYQNTGPWWDSTNIKANDGISFEEQKKDPGSLWNHYKKIIQLKKSTPALAKGKYHSVKNENDQVVSFLRYTAQETVLVVVNLSSAAQQAAIHFTDDKKFKTASGLTAKESKSLQNNSLVLNLKPYELKVFKLESD
jgi:glycosidase